MSPELEAIREGVRLDKSEETFIAVRRLEEKLDRKIAEDNARFEAGQEHFRRHDARLDKHDSVLEDHEFRLHALERKGLEFAENLTKVAGAAANAADIGLQAQRRAGEAMDDASKLVKSAMAMHSASVAAAVETAMGPLSRQVEDQARAQKGAIADAVKEAFSEAAVEAQKSQDSVIATKVEAAVETAMKPVIEKTDAMVANVGVFLKTATKTVTSRPYRVAFGVAVFVGAIVGSAAFAWHAASELASAKASATAAATQPTPPAASASPAALRVTDAGADH